MTAIFNNTLTNIGNTNKLLSLINSTFYFAIAKSSAWDSSWGDNINDTNPPLPNPDVLSIPEILLYKQPYYQTLAVESNCYDIDFANCGQSINTPTTVTLIDLSKASSALLNIIVPQYLYFKVEITVNDIALLSSGSSFRIGGLFKDTTVITPNQVTYLPTNINNQGTLFWVTYFTPILSSSYINNKISTFEILLKV